MLSLLQLLHSHKATSVSKKKGSPRCTGSHVTSYTASWDLVLTGKLFNVDDDEDEDEAVM